MIQSISFENLPIGEKISLKRQVSASEVDMFTSMSMDANPIHTDNILAQEYGFRERLAQGMLIAAFFSGILGTVFSSPAALCLSQSVRFLQPVYIGDLLNFVLSVTHKSEALQVIIVEVIVLNQEGVTVLTGETTVKMFV